MHGMSQSLFLLKPHVFENANYYTFKDFNDSC